MKIKHIYTFLILTLSTFISSEQYTLTLPTELAQLFEQAYAVTQNKEEYPHILLCSELLAQEKPLAPKDLITALEEVYTIAQTQEIVGLEELSTKLVSWLKTLIDELIKDTDFAQTLEAFDFKEEDEAEEFEDEPVTRSKNKNKSFKNVCVQRNVSIGGNLCVAGKALFKSGIAFALTGALTITAPLNVTTVQGENAVFTSASAGTVNIGKIFGITNMTGSTHPIGSYPLFYNPTTGILYCAGS